MSTLKIDDKTHPLTAAMRKAGMEFTDVCVLASKPDVFKVAFFLGAIAARECVKNDLTDAAEAELQRFEKTGCTCGKAGCEVEAEGRTLEDLKKLAAEVVARALTEDGQKATH